MKVQCFFPATRVSGQHVVPRTCSQASYHSIPNYNLPQTCTNSRSRHLALHHLKAWGSPNHLASWGVWHVGAAQVGNMARAPLFVPEGPQIGAWLGTHTHQGSQILIQVGSKQSCSMGISKTVIMKTRVNLTTQQNHIKMNQVMNESTTPRTLLHPGCLYESPRRWHSNAQYMWFNPSTIRFWPPPRALKSLSHLPDDRAPNLRTWEQPPVDHK